MEMHRSSSHPSRKNKDAARVGHPKIWGEPIQRTVLRLKVAPVRAEGQVRHQRNLELGYAFHLRAHQRFHLGLLIGGNLEN
jgi:hypothetical protein